MHRFKHLICVKVSVSSFNVFSDLASIGTKVYKMKVEYISALVNKYSRERVLLMTHQHT